MNRQDVALLHAYCTAALGRPWSETDIVMGHDIASIDQHVAFSKDGKPVLTEEGEAVLLPAILAMKSARNR